MKTNVLKIFTITILTISILAIFILLVIWTDSIKSEDKREELKNELNTLIEKRGVDGVFSLLEMNVKNYLENEDEIVLFDDEEWSYSHSEMQNINAFEKSAKSVIEIFSNKNNLLVSHGSGVIVSTDGYVVTAAHVLDNGTDFIASTIDSKLVELEFIAKDNISDIAILKMTEGSYIPIEFSKKEMKIGAKVLAIGHPKGYSFSLTEGIISSLDRIITLPSGYKMINMIQTDVSLKNGNSGGVLLDSDGNMIALNISVEDEISFALPLEDVLYVSTQLLKNNEVTRAGLDLIALTLTPSLANYLEVSKGVVVSQVAPKSSAEKAQLKGGDEKIKYGNSTIYINGDIIIAIDDIEIINMSDYLNAFRNYNPGDKVDILILRDGKEELIKDVVLDKMDETTSKWVI